MNEYQLVFLSFAKIVFVACFGLLYALGGRKHKWLRRVLGAMWLGMGVIMFAHIQGRLNWWYSACILTYFGGLSMGYGGEKFKVKFRRRLLYALAVGLAGLPIYIIRQAWVLGGFQLALAAQASLVLGLINPVKAAEEESLIAVLSSILVLFAL